MPVSITMAAESGKGSLVKKVMFSLTPLSRTVKSFFTNPSTRCPLGYLTLTGTTTKFTSVVYLYSWSWAFPEFFGTLPRGTVVMFGGGGVPCGAVGLPVSGVAGGFGVSPPLSC